jgi:hypothetical protein
MCWNKWKTMASTFKDCSIVIIEKVYEFVTTYIWKVEHYLHLSI